MINGFDRIPELDGLRGVAILVVMVAHFSHKEWAPGGFGVTLFFVISGFIITRLFFAELHATGSLSVSNFYMRRFLRLAPALFVSVLAISMTTLALGEDFSFTPVIAALTYLKNYQTLFLPDGIGPPLASLGIYWSLAVEEHFYILLPPLFLALARKPTELAFCLLVLIIAVLAWRFVLVLHYAVPSPRTYMASETRFDSPLMGAFLATLCLLLGKVRFVSWRTTILLAAGGFVMIAASFFIRDQVFRETLRYSIQNAGIAMIVFVVLFGRGMVFIRACLARGPLRAIGIISYSLYLWHVFILYLSHRFIDSAVLASFVAACASFAVGYVSWHLLENGTARLRERFGSRTVLKDEVYQGPAGSGLASPLVGLPSPSIDRGMIRK
jgi:peptidoglycan/LPS O-acetylase OafA/YrhL